MPHLTYAGHATVLIEMDGVRLLTDPILRDNLIHLRRRGIGIELARYQAVNAVLISHMHWDHLDLHSLKLLDPATRLIVPHGSGRFLRRNGFRHVEEVREGQTTRVGTLKIAATYAHHSGSRYPFGPVGECLGYLIHGHHDIYFAGDTDLFPEMATLADDLDVALLPVWGWGPTLRGRHLNPQKAAQSLTLLRPRLAVPIHWGTFYPWGMGWLEPRFLTHPPHAFARFAARLAPEVKVRVVAPGHFIRLGGEGGRVS